MVVSKAFQVVVPLTRRYNLHWTLFAANFKELQALHKNFNVKFLNYRSLHSKPHVHQNLSIAYKGLYNTFLMTTLEHSIQFHSKKQFDKMGIAYTLKKLKLWFLYTDRLLRARATGIVEGSSLSRYWRAPHMYVLK